MTLQFTYNGFTGRVLNKHTLNIADGELAFSADFLVTGADDAAFAAACAAAESALSDNNLDLTIAIDSENLITWSHAANSGFLTRASVRKVGSPLDTARSRLYRFDLTAQREPQTAARAGRREADIIVDRTPDTMRRLRFSGVWTALVNSGSPQSATAAYAANVQAWVDGWLAGLLTPTPQRFWQRLSEPSVRWEDENKVLRFEVAYQETSFAVTPREGSAITTTSAKGVFTTGRFIRQDPQMFGQPIYGGSVKPTTPRRNPERETASSFTAPVNEDIPRRYSIHTVTHHREAADWTDPKALNAYWETTIRPWIVATVRQMFGHQAGVIFEAHSQPMGDAVEKTVECQAQVLIVKDGGLIEYDETASYDDDRRLIAEHVWDGQPDSYDLSEGGRELKLILDIRAKRTTGWPNLPNHPGGNWVFLRQVWNHKRTILDPVTGAVEAYERQVRREYLFVRRTPQPRGPITGHARLDR